MEIKMISGYGTSRRHSVTTNYSNLDRQAEVDRKALLKATDAIYAAKSDNEIKQRITSWREARDALPDLTLRMIEDERVATSSPVGRRPIRALQEQAVANILTEVDSLPDPVSRVATSMIAFHYAPPKSFEGQDALAKVLKHMDQLPEVGQRLKAAKFVLHYSNSRTELRQEAAGKIVELQKLEPKPTDVAWRFWQKHVNHAL
jgi:hypothetical protein